uniref:DNA-directed RNA polymerase n=1 Tax=Termitomyces bulborhizus TaxID=858892 RepID=A0A8F1ACS2_9AGAR|nr:RNA polymerase [Termitomyces bulborhizus]
MNKTNLKISIITYNRNYSTRRPSSDKKDFYNVVALSAPDISQNNNKRDSSIASVLYLEEFSFNASVFDRMSDLNYSKIVVVIVGLDQDISNGVETIRYAGAQCVIEIVQAKRGYFFSDKCFQFFLKENKEKNYEVFLVFKNISWNTICANFAKKDLDISGGSTNKRHLLSPIQYKLSIFLYLIKGNFSSQTVRSSFHKKREEGDKKRMDYNSKELKKAKNELKNPKKSEENSVEIKNNTDNEELNKSKSSPENNQPLTSNIKNPFISQKREMHTSTKKNKIVKTTKIETSLPPSPLSLNLLDKKNKIGDYLNSIKELISETKNSEEGKRREIQLLIENSWISIIEKKLDDERYLINTHQNFLYNHINKARLTLDIMAENNFLIKKFPEVGNDLNKLEFLILTFTLSLSLYTWSSYNYIAIKLGKELLYLNYKLKYKKKKSNSNSIKGFETYRKELNLKSETEFYLKLGDFFLSIFQQFPHDIFIRKINLKSYFTGEAYTLDVNKDYLEDIKNNLIINPNTLPMICKPNEWSDSKFGGYLLNENKHEDIVTSSKEFAHKIVNKDSIYKTVNYLNSIKFEINSKLLDYLYSEEGSYILEKIIPENVLQRTITLKIAQIYRDSYFYLNTNTDWRGRIYTQSFYISYQGGDLSSAVLNFFEGSELTEEGKFYFYIYGANSHNENGLSKESFEKRLNWVKTNYNKIINLDKNLILSADNPFIFTAFCLNMRDIHNDPKTIIKTPVFLDATCSGIQHLAGLMKDLELGTHTNLIESSYQNKPEDIYSMLLKPINEAINNFGLENPEYIELSLVQLTRKEVKPSIMTKVYNVTIYGISQQLQSLLKTIFISKKDENSINEKLEEKPIDLIEKKLKESIKKEKTKFICLAKNNKTVLLTQKDIYKIAEIIHNQIFVCFPSLNYIYNYFIEVTKISSKLGIQLTWITPAGLEITQHYLKRKKKIISISLLGKTKKLVLRENDSKLDASKQSQAIIPNIIHSLDASHLMNLIKTASENNFNPIITIHDCFGTLPNQMGTLEHRVKKEFILLYSKSAFLTNFHNRFIQSLTDNHFEIINENEKSYIILSPSSRIEIPSEPRMGELDVENIINSKYIIS